MDVELSGWISFMCIVRRVSVCCAVSVISTEVTYVLGGLIFAWIVEEWVWDYAITVTLLHVALTGAGENIFDQLTWTLWVQIKQCCVMLSTSTETKIISRPTVCERQAKIMFMEMSLRWKTVGQFTYNRVAYGSFLGFSNISTWSITFLTTYNSYSKYRTSLRTYQTSKKIIFSHLRH